MQIHFSESWQWIIAFFLGLGILLFQYLKDETPEGKSKTKMNTAIFFFGLLLLLVSLIQTCKTEVGQAKTEANIDTTKKVSLSTKVVVDSNISISKEINRLTTLNTEIIQNIAKLDSINNEIATNTQALASDGKTLIKQNLETSTNINSLTKKANESIDKVRDEQTGAGSIPILTASTLYFDPQWGTGDIHKEDLQFMGEYTIQFNLKLDGENTLKDIRVHCFRHTGSFEISGLIFKESVNLKKSENQNLFSRCVVDTLNTNLDGKYIYSATVSWGAASYTYGFTGWIENQKLKFTEMYAYNNKNYTSIPELLVAIREKLKSI